MKGGAAALGLAAVLSPIGFGAPFQKPDTVYRVNSRTGKTQAIQGSVTADGLEKLSVTLKDGDSKSYDSAEILRVVWGDVPTTFKDAGKYSKRGEWEDAVTNYQEAASDADARPAVQAAARLRALESLLAWGKADPARFTDAVAEADRFISEFADSRHYPTVRSLKARAAWLSGDATAARDGYKSLFEAGKGGVAGFDPILVAEAALQGGLAALSADDTASGRELLTFAEGAFRGIESDDASVKARAAAGLETAALGELLSKVARKDFSGVQSSLERAADKAETVSGKAAAKLALGQALLGQGKPQDAILHLAWVSAMDHSSADRRAAALIGMAEASVAISEDKGPAQAKSALERVVEEYGATPSARVAAERLKTM